MGLTASGETEMVWPRQAAHLVGTGGGPLKSLDAPGSDLRLVGGRFVQFIVAGRHSASGGQPGAAARSLEV